MLLLASAGCSRTDNGADRGMPPADQTTPTTPGAPGDVDQPDDTTTPPSDTTTPPSDTTGTPPGEPSTMPPGQDETTPPPPNQ